MAEKYDPRVSLPRPSRYTAIRMQPQIGDLAIYQGVVYLIASVLDMNKSLYTDSPLGIHYVLRRSNWDRWVFLIVPAKDLEQPVELAA